MFLFIAFAASSIEKPNSDACQFCQELIEYIEKFVIEGWAEKEIIEWANGYCATLSQSLALICEAYVDQSIEKIMKWIAEGVDKLEICQRTGLCTSQSHLHAQKRVKEH
jgi:uncharacterized membrane protein YheB (UPF0754 family)